MFNFLLVTILVAQSKSALEGRSLILSAENFIFITTDFGIYRYDKNACEWSMITRKNGLPDHRINFIGIDEGTLWIGTDSGVAFADLKLLNFRTYDSLRTSGIAFDDDYAYIGGTGGIERYDKYRDQWFLIETRGAVNDLFLLNDQLFVAGDSGLEIYNTRYEKFEELSYQISERLVHIINTQHNIFFIGDNYFFKYNKETHTWQRLEQFSFNDYAVQGDSVWMATDDGIMVYDEIIGRWDRYRKTEWYPDKEITALSVTSKMLVLGSNYGVNVIDNQTQSCTRYNLTSGLIDEKILKIYEENGQVFLLTPEWIQYLDDKGNWKRQKIEGEFIPRGRLFTIDEAGGYLTFSPDFRVSLQGRATIEYEREDTIAQTTEIIDGRMLIGKPGDRQMVVYYDDTEKERKLYGATYQDPGGFLSRARVGKIRTELYKSSLMPLVSYLGGGGRLETKFAALDLSAGKLGSAFAVEYFTGNSDQHLVLIRDINYIRNVFFIIDTINPGLKPRSESVYVDNRNPLDNTKNTLTGFSIAGVSGDFDYQYRGIDYTVDEERGIIQFLKAISDSAVVAIRYNGGQERILQGRGQDSLELKNYYMLGATNIMPRTLIVRIFRDNIEQPLYLFGLDENRDGFVDEQFINYLNGHLHFPARQPFPDSVYYPNPVSYYNIMVSYRARTGSYILAHTPIVVNSEEVILDGVPLRRGIDYIIDYSTGNLVFLEKGQVLPKSEIEVRYEYEIETDSLTSCAQLVVSPDQKLEIIPGFYQAGQRAVGNLTSEWQMNLKSCNLKVRPEVGVNIEDRSAYGGKISLYSSFNRLRVNSFYENYLPGFESFGRRVCNYGELSNRYYLYSKYEFTNYLSMDGSFDRREAQDTSLDARYYRRIATGGLYFTHPALPVVSISGAERNYSGDAPQPHQKRYSVYSSIDYPVPDKYLKPISVKNLKIGTSYYIEQIKERGQMDLEARNRQLTFSSTLPLSNDVSLYIQEIDEIETEDNRPIDQSENLKLTFRHDFIPGIFIANCYEIDDVILLGRAEAIQHLDHSFLSFAKLGPGEWYYNLSLINIDLGFGRILQVARSGFDLPYERFRLDRPEAGGVYYQSITDNYSLGADIRPGNSLILNPVYTFARTTAGYDDDLCETREHNLIPKIELTIGGRSMITAQHFYKDKNIVGVSNLRSNNPVLEWQLRWTPSFRTRLRLSTRREVFTQARIREEKDDVAPSIQLGYYNDQIFKEFEILTTLGLTYQKAINLVTTEVIRFGPLFELNMKPRNFFIIRASFQPDYTYNLNNQDLNEFSPNFKLKTSLQF